MTDELLGDAARTIELTVMASFRGRVSEFLRQPYGVGAPLNVHMFAPSRLVHHTGTAIRDPRYFVNRLRVMGYQVVHPDEPWLTKDALRRIKGFLTTNMRAFEWGSGKSTLWLSRHVRELISVEHEPAWYERVTEMLSESRIVNTQLRFAEPTTYAEQIAGFPDGTFDFVLVDGAERDACIRAAAAKVRKGGWLVLDNADGEWDCSPLAGYRRIVTNNGVWQTDIFVRDH
jgi:hypothetical protein